MAKIHFFPEIIARKISFFFHQISKKAIKSRFSAFLSTFAGMKTGIQADSAHIYALISEGEHQHQDFKFEISDARKIARTLSAFSNTEGGRLLIGVKDNGKIAGIRSEEEIYMIEAAAQLYCSPQVEYTMQTFRIEGRSILVVQIVASKTKPVCARSDEGKWLAYVRVKDENILATAIHLRVWEQSTSPVGELVTFTEREQLLLDLLNEYESLSVSQYARKAKCSGRAACQLMARFIRFGIVEQVYENQRFTYRLKK